MAETRPVLGVNLLRAIAVALLALKLGLMAATPVFMDEAYYWLWGQHPALSYFDHPPLNAWLQGLSGAVFGWNVLGVRAMVVLTLLGDLVLLALFARRLQPGDWRGTFWLSAILFLVTPVFFGLSALALSDHLLIFVGLLASYGFASFLLGRSEGKGLYRWLYLGAVALGFAGLAKYNAALIGLGLLAFIIAGKRYRPQLADKHLWFAAMVALAMQAPVLIWNLQQGFVSYEFILGGRHGGQSSPANFSGLVGFFLGMAGLLGPFLLVPLAGLLFGKSGPTAGLGSAVFWVSSGAVLIASLFTDVLFHWNLAAYIGVLPFLAYHLRHKWVLFGHLLYGLIAYGLAITNFAVVPVMAMVSYADQTSAWSYGWDEIAARVEAAETAHSAGFIAATDYTLAAQLGFARHDADITSLSPHREQFDFWFDAAAHAGETALILADLWRPLTPEVAAQFATVAPIDTITISRLDKAIDTYTLYLAQGFVPPAETDQPRRP